MLPMANMQQGIEFEHVNMLISKMFEKRKMLLLLFCLNKDQFWFLLILWTFLAEVRQKKHSREMRIAQPPWQL